MNILFYLASATALAGAFMAITRRRAMHALLYLVVTLLALAVVFFSLGAVFAAALEVIVYAGAVVVLFVFVVMMLNPGVGDTGKTARLRPSDWFGPALLGLLLAAELIYAIGAGQGSVVVGGPSDPKAVALSLFGPYLLAVELASFLLLAGMVGAFHLGTHARKRGGAS